MLAKKVNPVEYYTSSEYKENLIKKFFSKKKMISFVGTCLIALIFLTDKPLIVKHFDEIYSLIYVAIIICSIGFVLYLVSRSIDSYNNKIYLSKIHHNYTHKLRDLYVKSMNSIHSKKAPPTIMEDACNIICQEIGTIFNEIKKSKDNGAAIRLAKKEKDGIYYETRGRYNLDSGRERTSENIPLTTGLPAYLNKKQQTGCLIYHNIFDAAKMEAFRLTSNEKDPHGLEIISLMALPLNCGFNKAKKEMIGILYITSPQESFFTVHDVDFARNLADIAAIIITQILYEIKIKIKQQK